MYCTEQWVNRLVLFHIDDLFYEKVEYEKLEIIVLTQIAKLLKLIFCFPSVFE